jgi:pimeloyl-ACP methyl ester carboxylesterase
MSEPLPVVLIPGLLASARLYAAQIPQLWHFGPVTLADHTRDDSIAAIAARILATAPQRFALAGLSMGGYLAFEILRQAPQRVARLALLDTSARADTPEQSSLRRSQMQQAENGQLAQIADAQFERAVHAGHRGDAALRATNRLMAEEVGAAAFVRQQRALIGRPDSRPGLAEISCPTLVLVGDGDELTPPQLAAEIAAAIRGAHLVTVAQSGHLSTLEQPEAVSAALCEWLAG